MLYICAAVQDKDKVNGTDGDAADRQRCCRTLLLLPPAAAAALKHLAVSRCCALLHVCVPLVPGRGAHEVYMSG